MMGDDSCAVVVTDISCGLNFISRGLNFVQIGCYAFQSDMDGMRQRLFQSMKNVAYSFNSNNTIEN